MEKWEGREVQNFVENSGVTLSDRQKSEYFDGGCANEGSKW